MATNAGRDNVMLPLESLLNPIPVESPVTDQQHSLPEGFRSSVSEPPSASIQPSLPLEKIAASAPRASRNTNVSVTPRTQGPIHFPPYEDLPISSVRELSRFQVRTIGQIHQSCEHIPYNSAKRDFYEKTGRESIEAFKYEFRVPDQDVVYTIMWDYNVGLVRMTPFFKCLGYAKTKPSQMLDKNPGLRDITPSVTGGSVAAQGYWMPFTCAKAVCATFCFEIAAALIPLFGPHFPSDCIPPQSSFYKEMVINPQLIAEATEESNRSRQAQMARSHFDYANSRLHRFRSRSSLLNQPAPALSNIQNTKSRQRERVSSGWTPINADLPSGQAFASSGSSWPLPPRLTEHGAPSRPTRRLPTAEMSPQSNLSHYTDISRDLLWKPRGEELLNIKRPRPDFDSMQNVARGATRLRQAATAIQYGAGLARSLRGADRQNPNSGANIEDYAAAEVLIRLQNRGQEPTTSVDTVKAETPSLMPPDERGKKRPKANSF